MRRVSASLTVVMLAASGHPVTPTTLRSWVYRGHITRGPGGYDLQEILTYIEHRENQMDGLERKSGAYEENGFVVSAPMGPEPVTYVVDSFDDAVIEPWREFVRKHDVNPNDVVMPARIELVGDQVTFHLLACGEDGQPILDNDHDIATRRVTKRLVADPPVAVWPRHSGDRPR